MSEGWSKRVHSSPFPLLSFLDPLKQSLTLQPTLFRNPSLSLWQPPSAGVRGPPHRHCIFLMDGSRVQFRRKPSWLISLSSVSKEHGQKQACVYFQCLGI